MSARDLSSAINPGDSAKIVRRHHPRRVAVLSMHTSPLAQAGSGDAGGMNVYIMSTARELAQLGVEVEIFTRAVSSQDKPCVEVCDGVLVRNIMAGPYEGLPKEDLPSQLCSFTAGVLRAEAARSFHYYDVIHSHYWLSGQVGYLAKDRWAVPLVHTAHTLAAVKNQYLADSDKPEPHSRLIGEQQIIGEADRLIVNTEQERSELVQFYDANTAHIDIVPPGVDTHIFTPGSIDAARQRFGLDPQSFYIGFIGRIQPLKGFDTLVQAFAQVRAQFNPLRSAYKNIKMLVVGGISGNSYNTRSLQDTLEKNNIADDVVFLPAMPQHDLANIYRACNIVAMPSHSESFGLVALEAQACGTPVVATHIGGLPIAVDNGKTGILIPNHNPHVWSENILEIAHDQARLDTLKTHAIDHAHQFSWKNTATMLIESYQRAMSGHSFSRQKNFA